MSDPVGQAVEFWSYRWCAPIAAALAEHDRFSTLLSATGISRNALSRTLVRLEQLGIMMRNTGYGHPLRPEYALTDYGKTVSVECRALLGQTGPQTRDIILKKWSMPCICAARPSGSSFTQLRQILTSITPRALSLTLGDLTESEMIEVKRSAPRAHPSYHLTENALIYRSSGTAINRAVNQSLYV
ncbi:MAG: winged helix-turn-helix transcriptional regulator [Pseudomonadota bacterium]